MGGLFLTAPSHIQSIPVFDMSLESIPSLPFPLITLLITLGLPVPVYLPFSPPLHIARLIVLLQLELCHRPMHKILTVSPSCQIKSKLYTFVFCTLIPPYLCASWFLLILPSKSLPIIEGLCPLLPPLWRLPGFPQTQDWPIALFWPIFAPESGYLFYLSTKMCVPWG